MTFSQKAISVWFILLLICGEYCLKFDGTSHFDFQSKCATTVLFQFNTYSDSLGKHMVKGYMYIFWANFFFLIDELLSNKKTFLQCEIRNVLRMRL